MISHIIWELKKDVSFFAKKAAFLLANKWTYLLYETLLGFCLPNDLSCNYSVLVLAGTLMIWKQYGKQ